MRVSLKIVFGILLGLLIGLCLGVLALISRTDLESALMTKPELTIERLLKSGFEEVGCWEISEVGELRVSAPVPAKAGVYAFAIDSVVQYVGVAATSLKQRIRVSHAKPDEPRPRAFDLMRRSARS